MKEYRYDSPQTQQRLIARRLAPVGLCNRRVLKRRTASRRGRFARVPFPIYPKVLAFLLAILLVLTVAGGCASRPDDPPGDDGPGDPPGDDGSDDPPDDSTGHFDPGDMPLDFPVYPGARLVHQWSVPGMVVYDFEVTAPVDDVVMFLLKGIREAGLRATASPYSQFSAEEEARIYGWLTPCPRL